MAGRLGDPTISELLDLYPSSRCLRVVGAQLIKDVLEGYRPQELAHVFAFTSFSYAVSKLLYRKNRLDHDDILTDLGTWRDLILDKREKQAFDRLAPELWPESKNHLHFISILEPTFRDPAAIPKSSVAEALTNSVDPSGRHLSDPRSASPPLAEEGNSLESQKTDALHETVVFLLIFAFLQDILSLLNVLSGRNWIEPQHYRLYGAQKESQDAFYRSAMETFFEPYYQHPGCGTPACTSLLSVAEALTNKGHLRSSTEIRHYLVTLAAVCD